MAEPERAPDAKKIGVVILSDYEFYIDKRGVASIRAVAGKSVTGVIFEISKKDEANLDRKEGIKAGIYIKRHVPQLNALCYVGTTKEEGSPREGYLEKIVKAARDNNFSPEYIAELEGWINKKST